MDIKEKLRIINSNPVLWIQTYCKIVNKQTKTVPFILTQQQRYFLENIDKYNIILKCRQIGMSTAVAAYAIYQCFTQPNTVCVLMSYSDQTTSQIFDKVKSLYRNVHPAIRLKTLKDNRGALEFENHSKIVCCPCSSTDQCRGMTINYAHISEAAFCKPENFKKQMLAIEEALTPDGKIVIESTANGMNHFYDRWDAASADTGVIWRRFFYNWLDDKVLLRKDQDIMAKRFISTYGRELSEEDYDEDEKMLSSLGADNTQLMWRRMKIKKSGIYAFQQEYPSSPMEAFVTTGASVFRAESIHSAALAARNVKDKLLPRDVPSIIRRYQSSITCWKLPYNGKFYIGVDCAEGNGGTADYSTIEVLDQNAYQCFEFRSNKIKPYEFAELVAAVGRWYKEGLLVIETASAGQYVIPKIRTDHDYINMYKYKEYERGKSRRKLGWQTSIKSRPIMINDFVELFELNQCCINSTQLLEEMKMFQADEGGGKSEAKAGYHDDLLFAFAIAIQGLKSNQYYYHWGNLHERGKYNQQ